MTGNGSTPLSDIFGAKNGNSHGIETMLRSTVIILCLLYLAGCKPSGVERHTAGNRVGPANPGDAIMVSNATTHLRERLNAGACDLLYSEASEEFQGQMSGDAWRRACEQLRSKFGLWESSIIRSTRVWHNLVAFVDGTAAFSGGPCRFAITWRLENGRARLFALQLDSGGRYIAILEPSSLPSRLIDPPPKHPMWKPSREEPETRS
jgi:hypothetical protein